MFLPASGAFGSAAGGGGSILGSIGGFLGKAGGFLGSLFGGQSANRFMRREGKRNRDWMEYMSNSAVQRRFQDMKAAGVNPILAGKYDAGTPGPAMGSASDPVTPAISTALQMKIARAQVDNIDAHTNLYKAQRTTEIKKGRAMTGAAEIGEGVGDVIRDVRGIAGDNVATRALENVATTGKGLKTIAGSYGKSVAIADQKHQRTKAMTKQMKETARFIDRDMTNWSHERLYKWFTDPKNADEIKRARARKEILK